MFNHITIARHIAENCEIALESGDHTLTLEIDSFRKDHVDRKFKRGSRSVAMIGRVQQIASAQSGVSPKYGENQLINPSEWLLIAFHEGVAEVMTAWGMGNLNAEAAAILASITDNPVRQAA